MAALEAKLEEALEKGDSKTVAKLNVQIATAIASKQRPGREPDDPVDLDQDDPDKPVKVKAKPADTAPKVIPRVQQWLDGQPWWGQSEYAHVREFVTKRVDSKLQAAGYSPREDAYFEELERIIEEKYPGVVQKTDERVSRFDALLDDDQDDIEVRPKTTVARRPAPRAPVGGGDEGAQGGSETPRRKGAIRITPADVQTMRTFGLDPSNPKHVEGFIQNRGNA
jgi:hypothetical protein